MTDKLTKIIESFVGKGESRFRCRDLAAKIQEAGYLPPADAEQAEYFGWFIKQGWKSPEMLKQEGYCLIPPATYAERREQIVALIKSHINSTNFADELANSILAITGIIDNEVEV